MPEPAEMVSAEEPGDIAATAALPPEDRPLWAYPATYSLMGINLAVYLVMVRLGPLPHLLATSSPPWRQAGWRGVLVWLAGVMSAPFSAHVLTAFGSCAPEQILFAGQWWRLVTSIFVHVTLLHLLLNLWCLWNLGVFGEPLLGKPGLLAVYLLTGAAGMLQTVISTVAGGDLHLIAAGASGAVFGIAGILIVLLSNRRLGTSWRELRLLRLQVIFFALINLLLGSLPVLLPRVVPGVWSMIHLPPGALPRVDNSAHLGGLVCGLTLGVPLFPRMTSGRSSYRARQAMVFACAALLLLLVSYALAVFARVAAGT